MVQVGTSPTHHALPILTDATTRTPMAQVVLVGLYHAAPSLGPRVLARLPRFLYFGRDHMFCHRRDVQCRF